MSGVVNASPCAWTRRDGRWQHWSGVKTVVGTKLELSFVAERACACAEIEDRVCFREALLPSNVRRERRGESSQELKKKVRWSIEWREIEEGQRIWEYFKTNSHLPPHSHLLSLSNPPSFTSDFARILLISSFRPFPQCATMDSRRQSAEKTQDNAVPEEQNKQLAVAVAAPAPFATASLSLFAAAQPATHFFQQPKVASLFAAAQPARARVPTQASSLAHLSLSASAAAAAPSRISFKSTISANPLQSPLTLGPHRPLDPSGAAGLRRASIVWFRSDLRVHDNECLNAAHNESMSVLNVYCFDPRDYGKSRSGFDKTGPFRASFVLESVSDLRRSLRDRGSDLVVRVGRPEEVLPEMAKAVGAEAVYAHREASREEVKSEERIEAAMKEEGVELNASMAQGGKAPSMVGGETEALQRLKKFAAECQAQPNKGANDNSVYGATFSSKMSSWLSTGCISPRAMFEELKKTASNAISGANKNDDGGSSSTGANWLRHELLWRDFFRFITKKCSSSVPQGSPACTGALV
ncbi:hypothetical protein EUGRSUZ_H01108 [Eucalyptus grandis]|uniref:Uncharacterized protein n=2 Tax=Eucalyptus grandis TaxID=71139 RepID=A0ACC3JP48_EUCGR|nr:hypothetical protein EUGRSUZ_H01108 [Eucalyptus grandis]